jgi:hypothetical protein
VSEWLLLKATGFEHTISSRTRWMEMEYSKAFACSKVTNQTKESSRRRGGKGKRAGLGLALLKWPATEKRFHLSVSGVQEEGEERKGEGRKEGERFAITTNWKKGAKAWVYWQRHFGSCAYVLSE